MTTKMYQRRTKVSLSALFLISLLIAVSMGPNEVVAQEQYFKVFRTVTVADEINDVSVSKNGKYIGIATQSYAYLLNAKGDILHEPFKTLHFAWDVAVSNNGLMAIGASNNVYLVNSTGELWHYYLRADPDVKGEIKDLEVAVRSYDVAISPDGRYIVASVSPKYNFTKYLFLFSSESNIPLWKIPLGESLTIQSLSMSDDGNVIVAGMNDGSIYLYDKAQNGYGNYPLEDFKNEYEIETPVDVSPGGDTIAAGNSVGTVLLFKRTTYPWDLEEVEPVAKQAYALSPVAGIALCSDYIFAISAFGVVQPFSRAEFKENSDTMLKSYETPSRRGQGISVSEDCKTIVIGHGSVASIVKLQSLIPVLDTTSPDTMITSVVNNGGASITEGESTESTSITFELKGTDNIAFDVFECSRDFEAFSMCDSPKTFNHLQVGIHTLQTRAVDTSGNRDLTPATFTWKVEKPEPLVCCGLTWAQFVIVFFIVLGIVVGVILPFVLRWLDKKKKPILKT